MAGSVNKVILLGNVGAEPEIRTMSNGKEVASFRIATSEGWKDKATGEKRERTEWHSIVVFSEGLVSVIKNYVHKGSKLYIEGALQTRKWQDQSGNDRYTTEIVLQGFNATLTMLDGKSGGSASAGGGYDSSVYEEPVSQPRSQSSAKAPAYQTEELDDEIPF